MVSRADKNIATQFIADRLEESGLYTILARKDKEVRVCDADKQEYDILMMNFLGSYKKVLEKVNKSRSVGKSWCPILYKDGKSAYKLLVDASEAWRGDLSLKRYNRNQVNTMLHLRKLEKKLLNGRRTRLFYYDPEGQIEIIKMNRVTLDYSHVDPMHQSHGFVHDRESVDYTLPEMYKVIGESDGARLTQRPGKMRVGITRA